MEGRLILVLCGNAAGHIGKNVLYTGLALSAVSSIHWESWNITPPDKRGLL
jgi:hypothetical protein